LPLAQRAANRHHDQHGQERYQAKAEAKRSGESHYNALLSSAALAFMRILVAIAFLLIIGSLASALFFLMRDKGKSNRTVKALAFRVGFSITLFVLLLVANQLGWIEPTGIR
jgi:hypothetical protein